MASAAEEEWADGVDDFFAEFSSATSRGKSMRRQNADAHHATVAQSSNMLERQAMDRAESAEEARRRIAAAVVSRATTREIEAAARAAKKNLKKTQKKTGAGTASAAPGISSSSSTAAQSSRIAGAGPSPAQMDGRLATAPLAERVTGHVRHGKRHQKVDAKYARKEEAKENRVKYRRVLRKQRR
ncbi:hypothetical protein NESM_000189300 [Novymonas esmeraldas]|uniref:Uncharacterized protein n=1 Tax=Novymonas esmeraldas TaxID=1808958 RepID=A0AAW0F7L8_9TRYP